MVMEKVLGVPGQSFAFGVTVMLAITGVEPRFMAVKEAMFPLPLAAKPILVLSFVQSKLVPETVPEKLMGPLAFPLHCTKLVIALTVGVGFTVMVKVFEVPGHPLAVGVTVMVATIGVVPVFTAVNAGMVLEPDPTIPILVVRVDQL
jgi:hypothetical protein